MTTQLKTRPQPQATAIGGGGSYELIIIGGGPAGLTAALYAARSKVKILLIEKMILGGLASTAYFIENYPGFPDGILGLELAQRLQDQVKKLAVETLWGNTTAVTSHQTHFTVQVDDKALAAKAIIVATGTEAAKLGVPGEAEFRGRGVSYCATCDGPFYKDKNIIVVGGGNAAIEEALFLTRYAKKISVVHRRDELRADKILAERAQANPKIYFFWHSVVEQIKGAGLVKEIVLNDLKSNNRLKVAADGIFIYIGSKPNSACVKNLVKLNKQEHIITNDKMATNLPGVFAAGDVRAKSLRQIVTAAADGAVAADTARKYLEEIDKN